MILDMSTVVALPPDDSMTLDALKAQYQQTKKQLESQNKEIANWLETAFSDQSDLLNFAKQFVVAASLAAKVATSQPVEAQVQQQLLALEQKQRNHLLSQISLQELEEVINKMIGFVNGQVGHLKREDELYLEQQLSDLLGFEVLAELNGYRLNHSLGVMGGEQHLMRYPGDSLENHNQYLEAGIAANRGAFGWFTIDGELTPQAIAREKYYFAVQTMYLDNWHLESATLKPWYKFRKMIVINPAEGLAVVGVVGDAGPISFVKKQFGGSPEVIREGKIWSPRSRGRVILYFVNDPDDQVPLGVINLRALIN